jgi:hypothetical protein
MPRIVAGEGMIINTAAGAIQYSAVKPELLTGCSKYTLATIVGDNSGSVGTFKDLLLKAYKESVKSCKADDMSAQMLIRATSFKDSQIDEIHGFRLLKTIDVDAVYQPFACDGWTNLLDAMDDAISSTLDLSKKLIDDDYYVNGIIFVITDGCENSSTKVKNAAEIKSLISQAKANVIESLRVVLIKLNVTDPSVSRKLDALAKDAGIPDEDTIDAGVADEKSIARLIGFIHKSTSSTSQVVGSGGPSVATTF